MVESEGELYGSLPDDIHQILDWAQSELDEDTTSQWADTLGIDPETLTPPDLIIIFAPFLIVVMIYSISAIKKVAPNQ